MSIKTRLLTQNSGKEKSNSAIPELQHFTEYNKERYPYLLVSSADRKNNTQYDILIACPQYHLTLDSDFTLHCSNKNITDKFCSGRTGFLETLDKIFQTEKKKYYADESDLPFIGGWFVYLSYEMAAEIEQCLSLPKLPPEQPLAVASRCPAAVIFDKKNHQLIALAEDNHSHLLDDLEQDFIAVSERLYNQPLQQKSQTFSIDALRETDPYDYLCQVKKIKEYIVEGDIFQANLSRQWDAKIDADIADMDLFKALCIHNPSSFAAIVCLDNITIISSSPERLVSVRNGIVETRPIAGTRPRDDDQLSDDALANELLSNSKEQAEHIMLIDLERNDLGRVCIPGSVEVNELMVLESWQHVHHIVSNVRGELQNNKSPVDVLRAVFPGGTITGCPKIHCIEILAEMEQQARGAYTGSVGYINNSGSMDFNILIRTLVRNKPAPDISSKKDGTEKERHMTEISFRAGGGIVNDSIAEQELEETRAKAKGILKIFK